MRASSFPFLMLVERDRSKHGLVRQYAAVPLTACYLLHLVEKYSPHAWGRTENAPMSLPEKAVFPTPVGMPSEHMDKGNDKEPPARGAPHAETPLPHETEEAFCYHGNRDGIPAVCELFSYSTTFGVPDTGRVPVRMKVSTRPKTRSLPQKCPRAMEARNSGRRSSKRRSKAGSRVIMSACMP